MLSIDNILEVSTVVVDLINKENNGEFPKQKTDEWYKLRYSMITASEIASVLDCNIYESSYDLLLRKLKPIEHISNDVLDWGNMFEPIALDIYKKIKNDTIYQVGLVTHNKYKWLGASPDGIIPIGKLLEIKCPKFRKINGEIPLYYWIQVQIQMEVCNIDVCDYFECEFYMYSNKQEYDNDINNLDVKNTLIFNNDIKYYKYIKSITKTINRDKKWFLDNIRKIETVYNKILYYRSLNNGIEQLNIDSQKHLKRKISDDIQDSNKKHKKLLINNWDTWISATKIRNYMIDDPLIDYLELYYKSATSAKYSNTFQQCIMNQGVIFENNIIDQIKLKFPNNIISVATYQQSKSYDKYIDTIKYMKSGVPIIYQGVLHDYKHKIFGMPDLLIRSDWINKIFDNKIINKFKHSGLNSGYHYRVFEIKSLTLDLCSDGKHLCNSNKNNVASKGQLYIYNKILGIIQNYTPKKSYIIGKKWVYKKQGKSFEGTSFERVAHVNYSSNDKFIRTKTALAIKWIRMLKADGFNWSVNKPHINELKPNMCNVDDKWHNIKKQIANDTNDITELWMCGIKNRNIAIQNGINNWRTHIGIKSEMLGITGIKTAPILQAILDINQETQTSKIITPTKIINKLFNWRKKTNDECFIDFETITPEIHNESHVLIFMIGVGIIIDNKWVFKCFIAKDINSNGEKEMLIEFHSYINKFKNIIRWWHWGAAETYLYNNAITRHKISNKPKWCDMLQLFKMDIIVCRGMLNFSLKSVVGAFYKNKLIKTKYDSNINNGLQAMVSAYECYKNNNINSDTMLCIEKYNEIDCLVMYEIINYLRKNH